jgi:hypothetical protein
MYAATRAQRAPHYDSFKLFLFLAILKQFVEFILIILFLIDLLLLLSENCFGGVLDVLFDKSIRKDLFFNPSSLIVFFHFLIHFKIIFCDSGMINSILFSLDLILIYILHVAGYKELILIKAIIKV